MSYQLRTTEESRRGKRNLLRGIFFIFIILIFAFATPLRGFLSPIALSLGQPFFAAAAFIKDKSIFFFNVIRPEASLVRENEELKNDLLSARLKLLDYDHLKKEQETLLGLNNKDGGEFIIARVLRTPNSTPYDTIIIEGGNNKNIEAGNTVYAASDMPIGKIEYAYGDTSRIKLFSTAGETYEVKIGEESVSAKATGRGGGNFEAILPRGALVKVGDPVILPEITSRVYATVEDVKETEGGTFVRVLFKTPISFSSLEFVSIKKVSL